MQINLQKNMVMSLLVRDITHEKVDEKKVSEFNLGFNVEFSKEEFYVIFNCRVLVDKTKEILLVYKSIFKTHSEIDDDFKKSRFPYINAPSIAFAFLRAFIGNITMLSGFSVVMIPSLNFIQMYEDRKKQEEQELKTRSSEEKSDANEP
ncbi:protein-export chaperone SecB [Acetobacter pasteurianus]|uniref:protein-export chaperone SecB n=1 Tax=Acetobacter pasteurianus TaxID=438 RepID=UPI003D0A824D